MAKEKSKTLLFVGNKRSVRMRSQQGRGTGRLPLVPPAVSCLLTGSFVRTGCMLRMLHSLLPTALSLSFHNLVPRELDIFRVDPISLTNAKFTFEYLLLRMSMQLLCACHVHLMLRV